MSAREHPAAVKFAEHVNPAFVKLLGAYGYGRVFERANGTRLWDSDGREYLDFLAAFGVMNLGHNPPKLRERIKAILDDDAPNLCHVGIQVHAADLAERLAHGKLTRVLFSSSGGEAVESALKLARAATKRKPLLYCTGGFHGTGFGTLAVMGSKRMREPFEPLVGECFEIPFDDLPALEQALERHRPAGFLVEPIQAEAGVRIPKSGYLKRAQELCKSKGTLLLLDEVQTGIGRTGKMYAYEHEDFVPDILVLGKALGAGMVPISAALTTADIHDRGYGRMDKFDLHSTTFSGNTFGCRIAIAGLDLLNEEGLVENAAERGSELLTKLSAALEGHPFVKAIGGRGLLVGLELGPKKPGIFDKLVEGVSKHVFGQWLAVRLLEEGIVAQPASQQWNVLKLEPALTVTSEEIDRVVNAIKEILAEYRDLTSIVADAGKRLGSQAIGGWSF